jgi:hypothetical protein
MGYGGAKTGPTVERNVRVTVVTRVREAGTQ